MKVLRLSVLAVAAMMVLSQARAQEDWDEADAPDPVEQEAPREKKPKQKKEKVKKVRAQRYKGEVVEVAMQDEQDVLSLKVTPKKQKKNKKKDAEGGPAPEAAPEAAPAPQQMIFKLTAETKIVVNGEAASKDALTAGLKVKVKAADGVATEITAGKRPKADKGEKAKKRGEKKNKKKTKDDAGAKADDADDEAAGDEGEAW